jgi:hypothetical protein
LPFEVAGVIWLDETLDHYFMLTKEGTPGSPTVIAQTLPYETTKGMAFNWHTHPTSLSENAQDYLQKGAIRNIPSWMDFDNCTRASVYYNHMTVDIVISPAGFF